MEGILQFICVVLLAIACVQAKPAAKEASKQCKEPLGIQTGFLEDRDVKTSSATKNYSVSDAWCAATNNDKQFFAVDLGEDFLLTKIATQGKVDDKNRFVKSYELSFSSDNKKWTPYTTEGKQILDGNKDTFTVKYHKLEPDTVGRYIKIQPKTWNNGICSRMELYGCSVEDLQKQKSKAKSKVPETAAAAATKSTVPAVPEVPAAAPEIAPAAPEEDASKKDNVPAASKQESEATWKFLADNEQSPAAAASDNADLLELSKQLGAGPQ